MSSDDGFLAAAVTAGRRIVADAIWHDGRCNWVGAEADVQRPWRTEYRALDGTYYGGTAGVGLFLAQLAAVTGGASERRTAVGALRHAATRAASLPLGRRAGFHAGVAGTAWAAVRAGTLLGVEELRAMAAALIPRGHPRSRRPDVVDGAAGDVIGLLALADALDAPELVADAAAIGEELLVRATVSRHGWSWASPGHRSPHDLCGLAHGAAGVGWALLELFAATGDDRFRAGAAGALAYERSWLDVQSGTWPDLRLAGQRRGRASVEPSSAAGTWCHGDAGIALVRLRTIAVLGDTDARRDAEIALEATRRRLDAAMGRDIDDFSLCHGAAGAAEALLAAAGVLGGRWDTGRERAAALGRLALDRHPQGDWPGGVPGGHTPGFFLGSAGLGWFLLRLHHTEIPSPLGPLGPC